MGRGGDVKYSPFCEVSPDLYLLDFLSIKFAPEDHWIDQLVRIVQDERQPIEDEITSRVCKSTSLCCQQHVLELR